MTDQNNKTEFTIDREHLEITAARTLNAPRPMVWAAVTDPTLIAQWWGPAKYEVIVEKFEFRPGGAWRFIHRGDAGKEYAFHGVTTEIVPMERIVQTFNFEGIPPGHELIQTMTLEDHGIKTKLIQTARYKNIEDLEGMVQSGMESGLREGLDRLAALTDPKKELTIVRWIDAPRELVFKAWTDPALLAKWWGPAMFTTPVCELDVRPEGKIHIVMEDPQGGKYPMAGIFREIKAPARIVYSTFVSFVGNDLEPDMENLNTVTLEEENGKTKLTLYIKVVKATPAAEIPLSGQEMGWRQSLQKLAQKLAEGLE